MQRPMRLSLVVFLLLVLAVPAAPAFAQEPPFFAGCEQGVFADTGASWVICMPERLPPPPAPMPPATWNGNLVIFVHGYVSPYPDRSPEIPTDQYEVTVVQGPPEVKMNAPDVINGMGYGSPRRASGRMGWP